MERNQFLLTQELYNWQYFTRGPDGLASQLDQNNLAKHPTWVLHDGPAFAHSKSHVGHMYNKVLKDIVNRYKLFRGYRVHYVPGFDCHGTSVEDFYTADQSKSKIDALDLSLQKSPNPTTSRVLSDIESSALQKR